MRVSGRDEAAPYGRAREQSELLADALLGQVEGLLAERFEQLGQTKTGVIAAAQSS